MGNSVLRRWVRSFGPPLSNVLGSESIETQFKNLDTLNQCPVYPLVTQPLLIRLLAPDNKRSKKLNESESHEVE
jgi:hypothetical protein